MWQFQMKEFMLNAPIYTEFDHLKKTNNLHRKRPKTNDVTFHKKWINTERDQ